MKTLHLAIIILLGIITLVLGTYFVLNQINNISPKVIITDIQTNPQILYPRDRFSINATIYNNNQKVIGFTTDMIYMTFDKNAISVHRTGCSNVVEDRSIMPYQSVNVTLPYGCYNYLANSTGSTNATLHFEYLLDEMKYVANESKEFSIMSSTQADNTAIINANGGRPLDIAMHVNEIGINGQTVPNNLPLTLQGGENATLKIEIVSKVAEPLSLQLRVFNNVGNYPDLAFARVKFADDASGLPTGLTASFGDSTVVMNANSSNKETLFLTIGQTAKAGNYQIGVLGLAAIHDPTGVEMGNSQTLLIPITIK